MLRNHEYREFVIEEGFVKESYEVRLWWTACDGGGDGEDCVFKHLSSPGKQEVEELIRGIKASIDALIEEVGGEEGLHDENGVVVMDKWWNNMLQNGWFCNNTYPCGE